MSGRKTIRDVARRAGVSVGTVSHHLNASVPVANATARRIELAISALGYRIDLGARSLRSRRTHSVGLVLPNISNPFYAEVARAVEHALWARGYQTLLCDASEDPKRERLHLDALMDRRVDGILLIRSGDRALRRDAPDRHRPPMVNLDRAVAGRPSVTTDNRLGGVLAARHLAGLGHRRIGVLAGQARIGNVRLRLKGFAEELRAQGLELDPDLVRTGPQAIALGHAAADLLGSDPPPTAIFATNDVVAIGAWRTLLALGVRIPQDLSLMGYDDIEMSALLVPPLTTVRQDTRRMGHEAAELLASLLAGAAATRGALLIEPELMVRGSTGPAAGLAATTARRKKERSSP